MPVMEQPKTEYLTVEEIAALLGEKETSVRDWIRNKRLPAYKFGRRLKVRRQDLEKFIEDSKQ